MGRQGEIFTMGETYRAAAEHPNQTILYLCGRQPMLVFAVWKRWVTDASHNDEALTTSFPNGSTVEFRGPAQPTTGDHDKP